MAQIPQTFSKDWESDDRTRPAGDDDERQILTGYLDWQRRTLELKCTGLEPGMLSERAVPPSDMSLHGLVRHLAGVERWWLAMQFAGEDVPMLHYSDDDPGQDFGRLDGDPAEALALWRAECEHSREIAAAASLDDTGTNFSTGEPITLRWVLMHLLVDYARHNGHADLLRERLDGATGL
jgi:hypothetical protein